MDVWSMRGLLGLLGLVNGQLSHLFRRARQ
jgi:hypothetical protein